MHATAETVTPAEQDYLKEIYLLIEDSGRATTRMLADRLGVKPPSVTAMIKRLADDGDGPMVTHTPYRGVELTDRGRAVALEMLRHHRLIELFLSELLGVPWDQVHAEAHRLEHVFSEDLEERIAAKLGHPDFDPHGDPIPSREGTMVSRSLTRLTALPAGASAVIARIERQDPEVLQYLATLSLTPGTQIVIEAVAPFGGVRTVRVGEGPEAVVHPVGEELARYILTGPAAGQE